MTVGDIFGHPDRNWIEDFPHENGKYMNKCIDCNLMFMGHKRRVICKLCDKKNIIENETEVSNETESWSAAGGDSKDAKV